MIIHKHTLLVDLNKFNRIITRNQAVSLRSFSLFRSAAPVGSPWRCFRVLQNISLGSPSIPQTLHSTKKNSSLKISSYFFALLRSSSSHVHFLRSAGLLQTQYRFISLHSAGYVSLHSSHIVSAALRFFSGCSFAQPSGLAPLTSLALS